MSKNTSISWTDYSWSPWWGCAPVSPGCANCYASAIAKRFRGFEYRKGGERQRTKDWKSPRDWSRLSPLRKKRVFPSMCDPFDPEVPIEWKVDFWQLVWKTQNLTWLLLTKRPELWRDDWNALIKAGLIAGSSPLPKNAWLGVSVENQEQADRRIPELLKVPAAVRWLSVEPLLGPVDLHKAGATYTDAEGNLEESHLTRTFEVGCVDWVVVGGESGRNRRDSGIRPLLSIVEQCTAAKVPVFVKQDCALTPGQQGRIPDDVWVRKEFPNL